MSAKKSLFFYYAPFAATVCFCHHLFAIGQENLASPLLEIPTAATTPSKPTPSIKLNRFTGKINKNKVRIRLQPNYDAPVMRELMRNDLVLVVGETDDFYAIQPPEGTKGFVFRTFILDGVVEGNRVNVRTKPDLEAPVILQLQSGEKIEGTLDPQNPKWLTIRLPASTQFYIAKDFIEKVGDADFLAKMEKRREEVFRLLKTTETLSQTELQKPFEQIQISSMEKNYQSIVADYPDFPEASQKAQELLQQLKGSYAAKKMAYLEEKTARSSDELLKEKERLASDLKAQQTKMVALQKQVDKQQTPVPAPAQATKGSPPRVNPVWTAQEDRLYQSWAGGVLTPSREGFYEEQKQNAVELRGVIDPYHRPVKNKPGDFMLLDPSSGLPIAYLYSTTVNLQEHAGVEVSLLAAERPNCDYAFPAYFVLEIE